MRLDAAKLLPVVVAVVVGLVASSCPPPTAQPPTVQPPTVQPPPPPRPEEPPTALSSCGEPVRQCQTVADCTQYGGCITVTCTDGTCRYAAEAACQCVPGTCSADGRQSCECVKVNQVVTSSSMVDCPAATPACQAGQCGCDPKTGTACSHCGKWLCDGKCSQEDPPGYGQGCGCGLKGKTGCDGSCVGGDCPPGESCVGGTCRRPCLPIQGMECGCARKGHFDCDGRCVGAECPKGEECAPDNSQCVCKKPTHRCKNGQCCAGECCGDEGFCCSGRCCSGGEGGGHCGKLGERCREGEP